MICAKNFLAPDDKKLAGGMAEFPVSLLAQGVNSVPLHFGQQGSGSDCSSTRMTFPQLLQMYTPEPGFCPVVAMFFPPSNKASSNWQ